MKLTIIPVEKAGDIMPKKKKKGATTPTRGKKGGVASQQAESKPINPIVGAAVGAVIGAVIGAAAAIVLSDKETRENLKNAAMNLRDQAMERFELLKSKTKDTAKSTKEEVEKQMSGEK